MTRQRIEDLRNLVGKAVAVSLKLSTRPLAVSAGMPRSGSTLLFNMLRAILAVRWKEDLSCGWESDLLSLPKGKMYLIKTHNLNRFYFYRLRASYLFYSYRDIRTAAVSRLKKFNREITIDYIRDQISEYKTARKACDLCVKYEELIDKPDFYIQELARILGIEVDLARIRSKSVDLCPLTTEGGYSKATLLHKGHFTNTGDNEWQSVIPLDLQDKIHEEFSWWFSECGYPLD